MILLNKHNSSLWLILILVGNYLVLPVISISINNSKLNTIFLQEADNSLEVGKKSEHRQIEDIRKTGISKRIENKITRINRLNPSFGEELYLIEKQSATVHTITFSPDGKLLASGDDFGIIKLWDMTDFSPMKEIQIFQGHSERIDIMAFSIA